MCHFDTNGPTCLALSRLFSMIPLSTLRHLACRSTHLPAGGRSVLQLQAPLRASLTNARRPRAPPSMTLATAASASPPPAPVSCRFCYTAWVSRGHIHAEFFSVYAPATCSSPCCLAGIMSLPPSQIKGSSWWLLPNNSAFLHFMPVACLC
jgi:hypothetical protein